MVIFQKSSDNTSGLHHEELDYKRCFTRHLWLSAAGKTSLPKIQLLQTHDLKMCYPMWQKGLCKCNQVKNLAMGRLLEESGGPEVVSRVLIRRKEEGTMSKCLTMGQRKDVAMSQAMSYFSKLENQPVTSRRNCCWHLSAQWTPASKPCDSKSVLFQSLHGRWMVATAGGSWYHFLLEKNDRILKELLLLWKE